MVSQTKVTALVPAYQSAEFIQKTLDSLSRQKHDDFRVIISVDLCGDKTYEICLHHCSKDSRFSVIEQDRHLGYIDNCNFLIEQAQSDYATLSFHDDTLDPRYLKKLCAVLDSRPEVVMAYSDILVNFEDGSQTSWSYKNLDGITNRVERGLIMLSRKDQWWVPAHGVFRLDAARKVRGLKAHAEGTFSNDWPWLFHMSLRGQFQRTSGLLFHKFKKESGVTSTVGFSKKQWNAATAACMQELSDSPLSTNEKELIFSHMAVKWSNLKFVFIVGCQRTGTTMIGNILGAHPQAYLIDEPNGVYRWVRAVFSDKSNYKTNSLFKQCCQKARNNYSEPDAKCNSEGMLSDTVTHLILKVPNLTYSAKKIAQYFPNSFCIFAHRDIRDIVVSMSKLDWIPMAQNQLKLMKRHPKILTRYKQEISALENPAIQTHQSHAYIAKIKTSLRDTFNSPKINKLEIGYEDLVQQPETWCTKLFQHIQLLSDSDKQSPSHTGVMAGNGPGLNFRHNKINTLSIGQWQYYLTQEQQDDIWEITKPLMQELGYQKSYDEVLQTKLWNNIESELKYQPIIATGQGGSGTRLLSELLQTLNVFLGNQINNTGDSMEWVPPLYKFSIEQLRQKSRISLSYWQYSLQETAADILKSANWDGQQPWGWKLPESMLILPDIFDTFYQGKLIHIIRHPVDASLRRHHVTTTTNNLMGISVLTAAYDSLGWSRDRLETDPDYLKNAASWFYQVGKASRFGREKLGSDRYFEIRYEDICANPIKALEQLAKFLNIELTNQAIKFEVDPQRTKSWNYPDPRADEVWNICKETALKLGYHAIED